MKKNIFYIQLFQEDYQSSFFFSMIDGLRVGENNKFHKGDLFFASIIERCEVRGRHRSEKIGG